jgi:plasmid stabilization system protein ParE
MPVIASPKALACLRHIRAYIAKDNPEAASRVAARLIPASDRLDFLPNRGRPGREPGTRELPVRPYRVSRHSGGGGNGSYLAYGVIPIERQTFCATPP